MLINKGYSAGDIVCFKTVAGDEIVAKIVEVGEDKYVVSRPCTVIPSPQGLALMQSLISADINNNNVTLNKQHIVMTAPVVRDIENHYIKTTTGIEPVTKGGIIT
jgi:hypothetical protein